MLIRFFSSILGSLFLLPLSSFELFMMSFHLYNSLISFSFYLFYFLVVALVFVSLIMVHTRIIPHHFMYSIRLAQLVWASAPEGLFPHFLTGDEHLPSGRLLLLVTSVRLNLEARLLLGLLVFGRRCVPALGGDRRESGKASCLSHRWQLNPVMYLWCFSYRRDLSLLSQWSDLSTLYRWESSEWYTPLLCTG